MSIFTRKITQKKSEFTITTRQIQHFLPNPVKPMAKLLHEKQLDGSLSDHDNSMIKFFRRCILCDEILDSQKSDIDDLCKRLKAIHDIFFDTEKEISERGHIVDPTSDKDKLRKIKKHLLSNSMGDIK